ncbi:MAG TPA: PfkB family carbohydrate kinase [Candidatus Acidoferrales bacterium]|nr:PfkB family carbohydrate kinase [Candidatus Acidoferrales bacterium]
MFVRKQRSVIVDVVGVGLNAADTVIELPHFPEFNSKLEFVSARVHLGGQVATALSACRNWGISARYVGTVGDDEVSKLQRDDFRRRKIEAHFIKIPCCPSQRSFILLDRSTGERTILWQRDARLKLLPGHLRREWISGSRVLLVDGHDPAAATRAAKWAGKFAIPVVADVDNLYPGLKELLQHTDYLFASERFPLRLMRNSNLLKCLRVISDRFHCRVTGATLGALGAVAWDGQRFHYCRGFKARAIDTTGAGDVFHAGIVYGLLRAWPLDEMLEFSCAAAALNCTAAGARGGIKSLAEIRNLMKRGQRSKRAFSLEQLRHYERI